MIYIHIPFCKQKCSYCNFHFSTSLRLKDEMILAIKKEISLRNNELQNKTLKSLYFGGGTPSALSVDEIKNLIDEVLKYFDFSDDIEITLEANPEDLNSAYLKELSNSNINRLSIGVQSFFDEDLKLMNRTHNSKEAENSIKKAQDFGFDNLSIDLIYGSPTSNMEIWRNNLHKINELNVFHISAYALTIEPKTILQHWISKGKTNAPKEREQNEAFYYMSQFLKKNGFQHYEISNFSKPNFHSKHNSAYWKYEPYLGIGPSAHSYNGENKRSWNIANNSLYIKKLSNDMVPQESEYLTEKEQYNEMVMIGLRTMWGVDLSKLNAKISDELWQKFQRQIQPKLQHRQLIIENNHLKIPEQYWFLADGIASDLFML